jgi:hypothetical protein
VLVYLSGDNDLEPYAWQDLAEMSLVGSTGAVEVVVLMDTLTGPATIRRVTPGGTQILEEWGEVDMGKWETLRDFGLWGVGNVPAEKYFLVLWDHGDGWRTSSSSGTSTFKGFSSDETGDPWYISVADGAYAAALTPVTAALGRKLDLIGFDACLMGMWEVALASAPFADVLVASEETEPGGGWAYQGILAPLAADPDMSAETLGSHVAESYAAQGTLAPTQSVIRLSAMEGLAGAVDSMAVELQKNGAAYSLIEQIRKQTQAFHYDWSVGDSSYRDLFDFCLRLNGQAGITGALSVAALEVMSWLGIAIVSNQATSSYPGAFGLSTYFPPLGGCFDSAYRGPGAVWSTQTQWDEFLVTFANGSCTAP